MWKISPCYTTEENRNNTPSSYTVFPLSTEYSRSLKNAQRNSCAIANCRILSLTVKDVKLNRLCFKIFGINDNDSKVESSDPVNKHIFDYLAISYRMSEA